MDLKFTPCIDRRLLDTVERSGLIMATFHGHLLAEALVMFIFSHLPPQPHPAPLLAHLPPVAPLILKLVHT